MPDKPAQHDTRAWFEEPLRTAQAADGDRGEAGGRERTHGAGIDSATVEYSPVGVEYSPVGVEPRENGATGTNGNASGNAALSADDAGPETEPARAPSVAADHAPGDAAGDAGPSEVPERSAAEISPAEAPGQQDRGGTERADAPAEREPLSPGGMSPAPDPADMPDPTDILPPDLPATSDTTVVVPKAAGPASGGAAHDTFETSDSEATGPTQPIFSVGATVRQEAGAPSRDAVDDAETTVVLPVVSVQPDLSDQPGYWPGPAATQQRVTRFGPPLAPPGPDSAPTVEIPRIGGAGAPYPPHPGNSGSPEGSGTSGGAGMPSGMPGGSGTSGEVPGTSGNASDHTLRRGGLVAAAVFGLLLLAYGIDVGVSQGEVPRGVVVVGVNVGGMDRAAAEQRLREQLAPRLTQPITLRAGNVDTNLVPEQAGLTLDWRGTLDQAGAQPLNPWTRFISLFATREVGVVTSGDRQTVSAALEGLRPQVDREPVEGTIRFEGTSPIPVDPVPGQRLDLPAATDVLLTNWIRGRAVHIPVTKLPVTTTPEGVRATLRDVVEPAVSAPIAINGDNRGAVLEPEVIAAALRFAPDGEGGLSTTVDHPTVIDALAPQLAETEQPGKDAVVVIEGGQPVVLPSTEGRAIDWEKTLLPLPDVLRVVAGERAVPAVYATQTPKLTTEQANQLGITTKISTFTTGGFATDSGKNIRRVAEQVNGAIVRPGETFSLNKHTGPRTAANGYAEAGIIDDGRPARGIGGGVSQFATTLYNASYFAGMVDVEHKEHSYYISRYPAGREATVYEGAIDVKFRNDSPTGILIQTAWTPSSVTVTFWGTKHVDVESIPGPRTNFTEPQTRTLNGENCIGSNGSQGFTVTDTRVIRSASTGAELDRETRKVVYNPQPRIICEPRPGG